MSTRRGTPKIEATISAKDPMRPTDDLTDARGTCTVHVAKRLKGGSDESFGPSSRDNTVVKCGRRFLRHAGRVHPRQQMSGLHGGHRPGASPAGGDGGEHVRG